METKKISCLVATGFFMGILFTASSWANVEQIKIYKKAYSEEKPKCVHCHVAEKPKKDGDHELNEYGKKVKAVKETIDVDSYLAAGKGPEEKK